MMKLAEIEDGPSLTRMRSLAKELSVFILAPILSTPSGVENSAFLIDDTGTILGHYSKTHPVGENELICSAAPSTRSLRQNSERSASSSATTYAFRKPSAC